MNGGAGLRAEGLVVRLGGRAVVHGVDLELKAGDVAVLVGPNGAGKSTLMQCLAGLRTPNEGRVTLDSRPLGALGDRERARRIGYLPQTPEIAWPLDVHTFVRLGRTAHRGMFGESAADAAAVNHALQETGMAAFAERAITALSGGERARALIARALAGEPQWLLADEPLTGLDVGHQIDAARLLRRAAEGGAGVLASLHDLAFAARIADRVVVMAQGRILADGPPDLALSPGILRAAYGVDAVWVEGASGPLLDVRDQAAPER